MSMLPMGSALGALDTFLVSPKPGMDLEKGVPDTTTKELKPVHSTFANHLNDAQRGDATKAKSDESEPTKEGHSVSKSNVTGKPIEKSNAKKVEDPKKSTDDSDDDDSDKAVVQATPNSNQQVTSKDQPDNSQQLGADETIPVQQALPLLSGLTKAITTAADTPKTQNNSAQANELSAQPSVQAQQKPDSNVQKLLQDIKGISNGKTNELVDDKSKSADASVGLMKNFSSEDAGLPVKNLKHLVDGLFVQQSLDKQPTTDAQNPMAAVALNLGQGLEQTFDTTSKTAFADTMRTHLVNDMQPLVTKLIADRQGGEMTLSLHPAQLGAVKVDVQVDHEGVKVVLQAEQDHAKTLLQSQVNELKQQLGNAGLKVDDIKVSILHPTKSENSASSQNQTRDGQPEAQRERQTQDQPSHREQPQDAESFARSMKALDETRRAA